MKAKDLIKILEKYPERDIKIHNGIVCDWMDINVFEEELVKMKTSYHLDLINKQRTDGKQMTIEEYKMSNSVKKQTYEYKNEYIDYDENKNNYIFKPVFIISGKPRGLCTFDRLGTIHY